MKRLNIYIVIVCFIFYWSTTILFVTPKNYVTISLHKQEQFFNTFFFQKWSFFAPPPKYNDRLFFRYESKIDSTKFFLFEVIEPLQRRKSKKAPFNSSEDILDYILSSTIMSISDGLIAVNESINYKISKEDSLNIDVTIKNRIELGKKYIQSLPSFRTLKKYGAFIAEKNNIENIELYNMTIKIIQVGIPKFAFRNSNNQKDLIKIVFESDKISL